TLANPIRPNIEWPTQAVLPNSSPGNHFIYARFNQALDPASVLSRTQTGRLGLAVQVRAVNPISGDIQQIQGRAFVGGKTYGPDRDANGNLVLTRWIAPDSGDLGDDLDVLVADGLGFPGTEDGTDFGGAGILLSDNVLVFVVDSDDDLT